MSEQQVHTPGRIRYYENGEANSFAILEEEADGRWLLSLLHNGHDVTERQKANMRRIAACWNALVHVSTEQLETGEMYSMGQAIADLTRERDQLLEALRSATEALSGGLWDYGPEQDEHTKCNEVIERCNATIAKVTGSPT